MRGMLLALATAIAMLMSGSAAWPSERYALVIGNSRYVHTATLRNPVNDANRIARVLSHLGFAVNAVVDANRLRIEDAVRQIANETRRSRDAVAVVYFSGHGLQIDGTNYLVPVDAMLDSSNNLQQAVSLEWVIERLAHAGNNTNIIVLDACRTNPFPTVRTRSRAAARGLAPVKRRSGALIAFATSPGEVADDGEGENSPYASALAKYLQQPNLTVETMFKQVRVQVEIDTNNRQTPWELSSLTREFFFAMDDGFKEPVQCDTNGPYRVVGVEPNDALHVRHGPGSNEPSLTTLPYNAVGITQERCEDAWCRIRYGCAVGWVARRHLGATKNSGISTGSVESFNARLGDTSQGLFRAVNVPIGDVLNIREKPSVSSGVRQKIPQNGTKIEVHECELVKSDKWCRVTFAGASGWARAYYLRHMEKEEPPQ